MKTNNNFINYVKIFVYGIVTPSIITFGIYYTFKIAVKDALKEALLESMEKSFASKITNIISKKDNLFKEILDNKKNIFNYLFR
jgi:hypothetical protein